MIATTLSEVESLPASYPAVMPFTRPDPLPDDPTTPDAATWQRIEAWITRRWTSRAVVYVVEGPGEWTSRLTPFTVTTTECWDGTAWQTATLDPAPLGGFNLSAGMYRVSGIAGDDSTPPDAVQEAWRRLHEFHTGIAWNWRDETAYFRDGDGAEAPRGWAAKALQLSGAADLLRPYRRIAP